MKKIMLLILIATNYVFACELSITQLVKQVVRRPELNDALPIRDQFASYARESGRCARYLPFMFQDVESVTNNFIKEKLLLLGDGPLADHLQGEEVYDAIRWRLQIHEDLTGAERSKDCFAITTTVLGFLMCMSTGDSAPLLGCGVGCCSSVGGYFCAEYIKASICIDNSNWEGILSIPNRTPVMKED